MYLIGIGAKLLSKSDPGCIGKFHYMVQAVGLELLIWQNYHYVPTLLLYYIMNRWDINYGDIVARFFIISAIPLPVVLYQTHFDKYNVSCGC